mgnify:CR=1 FL=1
MHHEILDSPVPHGIAELVWRASPGLWNAFVENGGRESDCGWCKDRWGVSWQITPDRLMELVWDNPDKAAAQRAMQAMMTMQKLDSGAMHAAFLGEAA